MADQLAGLDRHFFRHRESISDQPLFRRCEPRDNHQRPTFCLTTKKLLIPYHMQQIRRNLILEHPIQRKLVILYSPTKVQKDFMILSKPGYVADSERSADSVASRTMVEATEADVISEIA